MICAWSLLYEELYGDMDKEYPIVNKKNVTVLGGDYTHSPYYYEYNRNDPDRKDPFEGASYDADTLNLGTLSQSAPGGNDTISFTDSGVYGGLGEDHFQIESGLAHTAYDDPKYYATNNSYYWWDGGIEDSVYQHHYPPTEMKPKPDLKGSSNQKYQEDKGIKDLKDYVSSTYQGHYTNDSSDVQTLDLIHSVGDAESFCRSNAIKYLSRYDKKGQAKRDILKAMHYCLLLYYFSGQTNETPTRGYETF